MESFSDPGRESAARESAVQKILVATDLTNRSNRTLEYAEALARLYNTRLLLLHVIDREFFWVFRLEGMAAEPTHIHDELSSRLRSVASGLRAKGIDCEAIVREGGIGSEIRGTIDQERTDLLILGGHRPGSLHQLAFGSTFSSIIHQTVCPVITIGPNASPISGSEPYRFDRILLATDFSAASRQATSYAAALASANGSRLSVAHVRTHSERVCTEARLTLSLREFVPELNGVEFRAITLEGDPIRAIVNQSGVEHVDLIVMGVKRASHGAIMLSEGIAHEVICRAHCPVFTIAQQESAHAVRPAFIAELTGTLV